MKPLIPLMVIALCGADVSLQAQTPTKGKQIIDQVVQALGGDAFLQMKTRVSSGRVYTFFHDRTSGADVARIFTSYDSAPPAKGLAIRERQLLGKKQDYSVLFLNDQAFDVTFRGARPVPDDSWERYERTTTNDVLYILRFRRNEPALQYEYVGNQVYLSTHVEVVDIIDHEGHAVRVSIDHNTMLPVRATFDWLDPLTRQRFDEVTDFSKWRNVGDGVMWPFTIERQRNGYKVFQMFADRMEVNQPLPAGIFDLPAGAKVLKKVN
ncbi:MAG TPA: hypothetical protein VK604_08980 [Bryobacteraceae bacterium]|nr:hypothetical protein [Bryobacteraceae bacterium]